jgi:hypothetical protein
MSNLIAELMRVVEISFKNLVQPSLVAIYDADHKHPDRFVQVGTGFLILYKSRPLLVTAKHVLRGHSLMEDPAKKAFHVPQGLAFFDDSTRLYEAPDKDIALYYADEFSVSSKTVLLSADCIVNQPASIITVGGYLARDFKRQDGELRPKPWIYSNVAIPNNADLVSLRYPKRRNVFSRTGKAAVSPIPRGKSGGPMLSTFDLIRGKVSIVGIFTDQSEGVGRGESSDALKVALRLSEGF